MQFLRIYVEDKHKVNHNWTKKDKKQIKEQRHLYWAIYIVFKLLLQIRIRARIKNRLYLHPIRQSSSYFTVLLECKVPTYPKKCAELYLQ